MILSNDPCIRELQLALEACNSYVELDEFQILFEAKENKQVANLVDQNARTEDTIFTHIGKALASLRQMIANLLNKIANFFGKGALDAKEKKAYEDFQKACKKDPSLKNKTITIKDFRKSQEAYKQLAADVEAADKQLASGNDVDINSIFNKFESTIKGAAGAVSAAVTADALINVSKYNREYANLIRNTLKNNDEALKFLQENLGKREANKVLRTAEIYSKRATLRRKFFAKSNEQFKSVSDVILNSITGIESLVNGAIGVGEALNPENSIGDKIAGVKNAVDNMSNKGAAASIASKALHNKDLRNLIRTTAKISGDASRQAKRDIKDEASARKEAEKEIRREERRREKGDYSNLSGKDLIRHEIDSVKEKFRKKNNSEE